MQPGGRVPAPGILEPVQAFANSKDLLTKQEVLTSAEMLRAWLVTRHLIAKDETISEDDFQHALAFREALRSLIHANNGSEIDGGGLEVLNQAARRAHLSIRFSHDGRAELEPDAPGLDGALGRILASVSRAMTDGTWARLKACRNEECQWVYYDTSKNRSGTWCTMAMCGNRLKAHTYRQRRMKREDT